MSSVESGTELHGTQALCRIIATVNLVFIHALDRFKDHPDWQGRTGAYYCLGDPERNGMPLLITELGTVREEKVEKYLSLSQEKSRRLAANPEHYLSWQSQNPDEGKYPGAVRAFNRIHSLSGLHSHGDEAVMFGTILVLNPRSIALPLELDHLAELSGNPFWYSLKRRLVIP